MLIWNVRAEDISGKFNFGPYRSSVVSSLLEAEIDIYRKLFAIEKIVMRIRMYRHSTHMSIINSV